MPPTNAASNSICWSGKYTAARCCDVTRGPTGDTTCWSSSYDYDFCCLSPQNPGAGTKGRRRQQDLRTEVAASTGDEVGARRRSLQSAGPQSGGELLRTFRLTLAAEAPTPEEANAALSALLDTLH
jgi:hypothetical protein